MADLRSPYRAARPGKCSGQIETRGNQVSALFCCMVPVDSPFSDVTATYEAGYEYRHDEARHLHDSMTQVFALNSRSAPGFPAGSPGLENFGLKFSGGGAHISRTMMLSELEKVLSAVSFGASAADYREAILERNVLGKTTDTTRQKSLRQPSLLTFVGECDTETNGSSKLEVVVLRAVKGVRIWSATFKALTKQLSERLFTSFDEVTQSSPCRNLFPLVGHRLKVEAVFIRPSCLKEWIADVVMPTGVVGRPLEVAAFIPTLTEIHVEFYALLLQAISP